MHVLKVSGMGCGSCVTKVEKAVHEVDAKAVVRIDRARERVEVESAASADDLCRVIAAIGYPAEVQR